MRSNPQRSGLESARAAGTRRWVVWCAAALVAPGAAAIAGEGPGAEVPFSLLGSLQGPGDSRPVGWSLTADFWAATLDGDFSLRPPTGSAIPTSIDAGFFEGGPGEGAGLHVRAEGVANRFLFFLDTSAAGAKEERRVFAGSAGEMNLTFAWFELGGGYRLIDIHGEGEGVYPARFSLDALLGGRVTIAGAEFERSTGGSIDGGHIWIEPYVGLQTSWRPTPKLTLRLAGDLGGLGVGSEFSWQVTGTIGYAFQLRDVHFNVHAGYRALHQEFDTETGEEFSGWDGTAHGPIVGVTFEF